MSIGDQHVAVGQNPNRTPSEHPNPHKNRFLGGEVTYPKMAPLVLTHSHVMLNQAVDHFGPKPVLQAVRTSAPDTPRFARSTNASPRTVSFLLVS